MKAIHNLLIQKSPQDWSTYWTQCGKDDEAHFKCYPRYIAGLVKKIKESHVRRIFLIHEDRALFLAGFLAALHAGVDLVLPQSDAVGLLKELLCKEDGIISNKQELSALTSAFISMNELDLDHSYTFETIDPSASFVTFYTSGSTGAPKEVKKSLNHLETEIAQLENMWGQKEGQVTYLSTVSHTHIYGLLFSLLWPVCANNPIKGETFSYWEDLLSLLVSKGFIISSPSHLGRLTHHIEEEDKNKVISVFSSGGPLSFEDSQSVRDLFGVLPIEVYGSTETGGIAYRRQQEKNEPWTPFHGIDLGVDTEERLCLTSPYLTKESTFQTEDRISLINETSFHLLGRADRISKIEGKRICLLEIEQKLEDLSLIEKAHVVSLETGKRNELGAVIVLSKSGQDELLKNGKVQFVRDLRKSLTLYFDTVVLPRRWRFVPESPLNAQGKNSHTLLKACFGEY